MSRPRVLVVSTYYFPFQGGTETHARVVTKYLVAHGMAVSVVTKRDDRGSADRDTIDGATVYRVPPSGPRGGLRKWLMLPFVLAKVLSLRKEFDVIYCPGYQGIGLAAIAAGWWLKRPVVLRSGNLGVLRGDQWNVPLARWHIPSGLWPVRWLKALLQRIYMRADVMVCNCRENETEAIESGIPRDRVRYLPNAVDVAYFRPARGDERSEARRAAGWPLDAQICVYVGRLSGEKGVMELLEAWRTLNPAGWVLALVGPDMPGHPIDAGPKARRFVAEHSLGDRVIFHGESTDNAPLLRAADLYVLPSHYESFSNALVEAMGTGLPVVATRIGGMLDCVVEGENGLLCRPRDAADLAASLREMMEAPERATVLGERARATVVHQFNETTILAAFATLFSQCAERRALRDASARA